MEARLRSRRRVALLAGLAVVSAAQPVDASASGQGLRIAGPVSWHLVSGSLRSSCPRGATAARVAVDPANPAIRFVSYSLGEQGDVVAETRDGGKSWSQSNPPGLPCTGGASGIVVDNFLAAGPGPRVLATSGYVTRGTQSGNAAARTLLSIRAGSRHHFGAPVNVDPGEANQRAPVLVDPAHPRHVLVELETLNVVAGQYATPPAPNSVEVLRSLDGGHTFSARAPLSVPPGGEALSLGLAQTKGLVVAAYTTIPVSTFPGAATGDVQMRVQVAISRDDGASFGTPTMIGTYPFTQPLPGPNQRFIPPGVGIQSMSASRDGDIAVAWADADADAIDLVTTHVGSTAWRTWKLAVGTHAIEPEVAALGAGRFAVSSYATKRNTARTAVVQPQLTLVGPSGSTTRTIGMPFDLGAIKDPSHDATPLGPMQGIAAIPGGVDVAMALAGPYTKAGDVEVFNATIRVRSS
jgi:hypothetical protein